MTIVELTRLDLPPRDQTNPVQMGALGDSPPDIQGHWSGTILINRVNMVNYGLQKANETDTSG